MLFAVLAGCDPCIVEDKNNSTSAHALFRTISAGLIAGRQRFWPTRTLASIAGYLHPGDDDGCRPRITKSKAQNQVAIVPSSAF